jgi:hypothetical protein
MQRYLQERSEYASLLVGVRLGNLELIKKFLEG